jgi:hypothetical protein
MDSGPSDGELREALTLALGEAGIGRPAGVRRQPSRYRTSFPLEVLEVALEGGRELRLIFKDLSWDRLEDEARLAKPEFLYDPLREPMVYESALPDAGIGSPRYYGSSVDQEAGRSWLFIEHVQGRELYQVGERKLWEGAARAVGEMHARLEAERGTLAGRGRLLEYDGDYYRRWIDRAQEFSAAPGAPKERADRVAWIAERYDRVIDGLLELPTTVIHGELYASNVLVAGDPGAPRVCPVDWELAAVGPGLVDLAALVSGGWSEEDREAIVAAYRGAVGQDAFTREQLDLCRLHLAVQWLGWAPPNWIPPEGQRHDWLGEALARAKQLEL